MSGDVITIPTDAPPYICADLLKVVGLEQASEGRVLEELEVQMGDGEMTEGDALRFIDDMPDPLRDELVDFCRANCNAGSCAMKGFGVDLVGVADPYQLSEAEQGRLEFYTLVDTVRACGKMSMGMPIL
jgi:hypothetical protein